jgi:hypothetical protein
MSRSNNRIPFAFLKETGACPAACNLWYRNITAEKIVQRFCANSEHNGLYSISIWLKWKGTEQNLVVAKQDNFNYWVKMQNRLDSANNVAEVRRHIVRSVKTWLKEWRDAKLATA